jgi:hypothetical protein
MDRKSSIFIAAGLVLALTAGMTSRALTLHTSTPAAAPVRIVVQQASPTPAPTVNMDTERG